MGFEQLRSVAPWIPWTEFSGNPIVIIFFNLRCAGCISRGLPFAGDLKKVYPGVNFLGVHASFGHPEHEDGPAVLKAIQTLKIPFPVVLDRGHDLYDQFHAEGTPHWMVLDASGQVVHSIFGSTEGSRLKLELALKEMEDKPGNYQD